MTLRVKKSDADAFAHGNLKLDEFRKKARITIYAGGDTSVGNVSWFGVAPVAQPMTFPIVGIASGSGAQISGSR